MDRGIFMFFSGSNNRYQKITPQEAKEKLQSNSIVLLDVRTQEEYEAGRIPNSLLLPLDHLHKIEEVVPNKDKEVIIYCRSGVRSRNAAKALINMGYKNVYDLGGILDWPYEVSK